MKNETMNSTFDLERILADTFVARIEFQPEMPSTNDLAQERPDLVRQFEQIFREARIDSEWYVNPGESREQIEQKKRRAADTGQLIQLVPPNHRSVGSR